MSTAIKIVLVDDHPLLRIGIKDYLDAIPNFEVVSDLTGGKALKEKVASLTLDVLVLDISMPDEDGFTIVEWLQKHHPKIPIVMYSMHNIERYYDYFQATHIMGYVLKSSDMQELVTAITKAVQGERYFDPKIIKSGVSYEYEENQVQFTAEEQKVLYHLATKKSNIEIAQELSISQQQLLQTRKTMLLKADVRNTTELLTFARKKNIIE
ncbi:MAG: response regulator transcription factor [Schleiferiaceae bacterium]|nr:response regulator transcription factor [Schleiferiaceae bacterium]